MVLSEGVSVKDSSDAKAVGLADGVGLRLFMALFRVGITVKFPCGGRGDTVRGDTLRRMGDRSVDLLLSR